VHPAVDSLVSGLAAECGQLLATDGDIEQTEDCEDTQFRPLRCPARR
jgi:hypothetical protein